ncbi:cwf21-domain-containing protein, partial [Clavulina sp. PMI_390]
MYNGIGLTTPRGSGTNGYVVRNLSHLRVRDPMSERAAEFDRGAPTFREPDQGILEHERKRKIEVACLQLQLELEDQEIPQDEIDKQVDALREKLLANLASVKLPSGKNLKSSDTHGIALAKKSELSNMARALGTSSNYVEGAAFDREKQEELKKQRLQERAARDAERE